MHRRLILIIVVMAILLFTTYFFIKFGFEVSTSRILGTRVTAGSLSFNILKWQTNIKNVRIYNPAGFEKGIMAAIPLIQATLSPLPFNGSRLHIISLSLEIPQLVVIKNKKGTLNVDELNIKGYKTYINIDEFIFTAGSVIYIDYSNGPKPNVQGYDVNIYKRSYKYLPTAEDIVAKVLGDMLSKTAIKGAIVYGAATAAGVAALGPLGIPIGAGIILTGEDSATATFTKSYTRVYEAACKAIGLIGDLTYEDKETGVVKGTVDGASVTVSINKREKNKTETFVSARKFFLPDRQTAAGVLYEISIKLK